MRITDCFLHWHVPAHSSAELVAADAIVTHEFGDQKNPSRTTEDIVALAVRLHKSLRKPLICQHPGDQVAKRYGVEVAHIIKEHLLDPGAYLDTQEVNRQVSLKCAWENWKRVIVCTHPHHMWRAGRNLERHGITALYPPYSPIFYYKELFLSRPFLATPLLFIPREILARKMYLDRGLI